MTIACAESGDGPIVLVLAPTRELAVQIQQECIKFGSSSRIKNTCVFSSSRHTKATRELCSMWKLQRLWGYRAARLPNHVLYCCSACTGVECAHRVQHSALAYLQGQRHALCKPRAQQVDNHKKYKLRLQIHTIKP